MKRIANPACCKECPFEYDGIECMHPEEQKARRSRWSDELDWAYQDAPPSWCPLRRGDYVIALAPEVKP